MMTQQNARTTTGLAPRVALALRVTILGTTMLAAPAVAQPAPNARPIGGQVSAGQASISQSPTTTTITQSSTRAAVNWKSFDVGAQQTVQFVQPSSTATTLNRVLSPDPSQIAGRITANGQIVIQNQSGVVFAKGAQVNAASVVVSAPGITDQNFMAGRMVFDVPAKPDAKIVNNGTITVQQSGLAALVAPQVANNGVITAKMGHIVLAGAETQTVDLYGDGMVSINVTGQVTQAPIGPDGKPVTALVTNSGVVTASGGTVELTARAVDGIVQNLVTAGGRISADTAGGRTGKVVVSGVGGSVIVEGDVSAAGLTAGTTGGAIGINATGGVTVAAGARVSASGAAGGGTIAIGTTLARARGGPSATSLHTAASATIAKGAVVTADATQKGNGGTIVLLSTQATAMGGTVSARGGPLGGNGGHVELSGETGFALTGTVDVTARTATGLVGTILIDPRDLYISDTNPASDNEAAGDTTLTSGTAASTSIFPGPSTDAWITPSSINNLSGAVTLIATRDLDVLSALDTTGSGITSLALTAGRNFTATAPITTAGDLTVSAGNALSASQALTAGGNVALIDLYTAGTSTNGYGMLVGATVTAGTGKTISFSTAGPYTVNSAVAPQGTIEFGPSTAGAAASYDFGTGSSATSFNASTVRLGTTSLQGALVATSLGLGNSGHTGLNNYGAATLDLHAMGAVTEYPGSSIEAAGITGSVGSLNLTNAGNSIASIGPLTASAGDIALTTSGALTTDGTVSASGNISLTTGGDITLDGPVSANIFTVNTTGEVSQDGSYPVQVGTLTGSVGSLYLFYTQNSVGTLGPLTSATSIDLYNGGPLTIGGTLTASYMDIVATGAMTLAANIVLLPYSDGYYYGYAYFGVLPATNGTANFTQTGTTTVTQQGLGSSYIETYTYGPGKITFNDLEAPNSELYVFADGGTMSGRVNASSLYIYNYDYYYDYGYYDYTDYGTGSAAFTNTTVGGKTGAAAAAATYIYPSTNSAYLVNGCLAGSSTCAPVTQPVQPITPVTVPVTPVTPTILAPTDTTPIVAQAAPTPAPPPVATQAPLVLATAPAATPIPTPTPAPTPEQAQAAAVVATNIAVATPVVTGTANVVGSIATGAMTPDDTEQAQQASSATSGPVGTEEQGQTRTEQRGVPLVNPLGEMSRAPLRSRSADPDLVVPNVSERDY